MAAGIFIFYLIILLLLALQARRRAKPGAEDFFLASRTLGPIPLLVTMAATNFSSFTIFGFAGAGYRFGYAYYPIMAFGTGFMALTFILLGIPARRAGKGSGAITPPELIGQRFQNHWLHLAYMLVMVVFTLPYLALQPLGAGYMLYSLFGIPKPLGAGLVVLIGLVYVLVAGLRGDVLTDLFQGWLMFFGAGILFWALISALGGFVNVNRTIAQKIPELFSRPGQTNFFTPKVWFSYLALWFVCDPMFPQLFQRFLAARDDRSLLNTARFYPLITGVFFFFPVALGVMAHKLLPALSQAETDRVLPILVSQSLSPVFAGVLTVVGLSALMSTMDSQLLTLSSMVLRDIRILLGKNPETATKGQVLVIIILSLMGWVLALRTPGTILEIATETFTGLAVLFPVTVAAAYWRKANPWAGLGSVLIGEATVILYHFKLLPDFGFLPVIMVVLISTLVLVLGSLLFPASNLKSWSSARALNWRVLGLPVILFILANDFWSWQRVGAMFLGLPFWLWYHIGLTLILVLVFSCRILRD